LAAHILQYLGNPPIAGLVGQPEAFLALGAKLVGKVSHARPDNSFRLLALFNLKDQGSAVIHRLPHSFAQPIRRVAGFLGTSQ
jgi:hypothetical protein